MEREPEVSKIGLKETFRRGFMVHPFLNSVGIGLSLSSSTLGALELGSGNEKEAVQLLTIASVILLLITATSYKNGREVIRSEKNLGGNNGEV